MSRFEWSHTITTTSLVCSKCISPLVIISVFIGGFIKYKSAFLARPPEWLVALPLLFLGNIFQEIRDAVLPNVIQPLT